MSFSYFSHIVTQPRFCQAGTPLCLWNKVSWDDRTFCCRYLQCTATWKEERLIRVEGKVVIIAVLADKGRRDEDNANDKKTRGFFTIHFKWLESLHGFSSQILSPWLGDIVDSGIGLSYRRTGLPALCSMAGRYYNPMPGPTISPSQWLRIWLPFYNTAFQLFWLS
jgi:hypothetical protein